MTSLWDKFWYAIVLQLAALQRCIIRKVIRKAIWVSSDGTVWTPQTMSKSHFENTMRLLRRKITEGEPPLPEFNAFLLEEQRRTGRVPTELITPDTSCLLCGTDIEPLKQIDPHKTFMKCVAARQCQERMLFKHFSKETRRFSIPPAIPSCVLCGYSNALQPGQLIPYTLDRAEVRCSDFAGCRARLIRQKNV